ncbi:hypothetical protein NP493_939g01010 [Ridgeia piscesae]|uniref:Uncharacterized protein n=1 Tax=Ridgeia piscesae TaxID=27915 RepID=A0AAD9NMM0_RIDPI|nr:hypothetical protein NP493_939g01010 [Ridgeia piscesae]
MEPLTPRTVIPDKVVVGEQGDLSQEAVGESGASAEVEGAATQNGVESSPNQDSGSDAEAPSGDRQGDGAAAPEHSHDDAAVVSGGDASCVSGASCGTTDTPDGVTDTPNDVVDTSRGTSNTPDGTSEVCDGSIDTPGAATDTVDGASDTPTGAIDKSSDASGVPVSSEDS